MAAVISLYLDENLSPKIAAQLRLRGIDMVTVGELGVLGDSDENHLTRATEMGRVLVTSDADFLRMAADGAEHAGIIYGVQQHHTIGDWVTGLALICSVFNADEFQNHVEYV